MKVEDVIQIQKFVFMLFNAFFVILGISIFGCAAWILFDQSSFITVISKEVDVEVVAAGLAVTGLVVVGVSLLGWVGGRLESRCLLMTYVGFLIAIALGQIYVALILSVNRNKIETFLNSTVDRDIKQYGGNETEQEPRWILLDKVQRSVKCCGREGPNEWKTNSFILLLNASDIYPRSCFNTSTWKPINTTKYPQSSWGKEHLFGSGNPTFSKGCQEELKKWLDDNIMLIFGMAIGLIFVQVFQLTFAVLLYQNIGLKMRKRAPTNLIDQMEEEPPAVYEDHIPSQDGSPIMDTEQNGGHHWDPEVNGPQQQWQTNQQGLEYYISSPQFPEPDSFQSQFHPANDPYDQSCARHEYF